MPTISLLMPLTWSYSRRLLRGVRAHAAGRGWHLVWVANAGQLGSRMRLHSRPDGIIALVRSNPEMRLLKDWKIPAVNVSGRFEQSVLPRVCSDNPAIGRMAAQHLLQAGYEEFLYVGEPDEYFAEERWLGFKQTLADCGRTCRRLRLDAFLDGSAGKDLRAPTGVFLYLDDAGPEVVAAVRAAGKRVPEDVGIIGVNDDEVFCDLAEVPLSSIEPGLERIGLEAARMLEDLLAGRKVAPEQRVPPVEVVARLSTRREAVPDPRLAAALRWIAAHACDPLRIDALVQEVGGSRRSLEQRFKQRFGHTLHDEIQRHRFAQARRLLRETSMDIAAVAKACGFASPTRFGAQFRDAHGAPPGAWRRQ